MPGGSREGNTLSTIVMKRRSRTMSTAMASPMPGRCTLTATSSPVSRSLPLYTCTQVGLHRSDQLEEHCAGALFQVLLPANAWALRLDSYFLPRLSQLAPVHLCTCVCTSVPRLPR